MTEELKWRSGPPPHAGWWNASVNKNKRKWRIHDGKCWSVAVPDKRSPLDAGKEARIKSVVRAEIVEWTDAWPDGARVQRINPVTGEVTGGVK